MAIDKTSKCNPKWVRERRGKYCYEYQRDGEYWAHGFYDTAEEAHQACLSHQRYIATWRNPEPGVIHILEARIQEC